MKTAPNFPRKYIWTILCLGFVAWYPILRLGFIADDPFLIQGDPTIRQNGWGQISSDFGHTAFPDANTAYYRPMGKMLIRSEFLCFGLHPLGYHAVNLALHTSNSLLTAELALALGFGAPAALMVGSLLAVNPIMVHDLLQAVGAEPFAYFLLIVSLLFLLRQSFKSFLLGLLFFGMALFCKESAMMIPALYLLFKLVRSDLKMDRLFLMLFVPFPYWFLRRAHMGTAFVLSAPSLVPFMFKAFPKIMLHYIVLFFFPWPLQSWPPIARLSPFWLAYLFIGFAVVWLLWRRLGRTGLFCIGWTLLMMLPKIPALLQNHVMMDHWIYDSALGLLLPVVLAGVRIWDNGSARVQKGIHVICGLAILFGVFLCHYNIHMRRTDELNYRWTLRFYSPDFALYRLGIILIREGNPKEAVIYLTHLCDQSPGQADYENALALAYAHSGDRSRARALWLTLLHRTPEYEPARTNLEMMQRLQGIPSTTK